MDLQRELDPDAVGRRRRWIVAFSGVAVGTVPIAYLGTTLAFERAVGLPVSLEALITMIVAALLPAVGIGIVVRWLGDGRAASWVFAVAFITGVVIARILYGTIGGPGTLGL